MLVKFFCMLATFISSFNVGEKFVLLKYVCSSYSHIYAHFMFVKAIKRIIILNKDVLVKYTVKKSKVYDHVKCTILKYTVMIKSIRSQSRLYDIDWKYTIIGGKYTTLLHVVDFSWSSATIIIWMIIETIVGKWNIFVTEYFRNCFGCFCALRSSWKYD